MESLSKQHLIIPGNVQILRNQWLDCCHCSFQSWVCLALLLFVQGPSYFYTFFLETQAQSSKALKNGRGLMKYLIAVISAKWAVRPESQDTTQPCPAQGWPLPRSWRAQLLQSQDTALEQLLTQQRAGDAPPRPQALASFCLWEKRLLSPN